MWRLPVPVEVPSFLPLVHVVLVSFGQTNFSEDELLSDLFSNVFELLLLLRSHGFVENIVEMFPHLPQDFVQFCDHFPSPHHPGSSQAQGFIVSVLDGGELGGDSAQAEIPPANLVLLCNGLPYLSWTFLKEFLGIGVGTVTFWPS